MLHDAIVNGFGFDLRPDLLQHGGTPGGIPGLPYLLQLGHQLRHLAGKLGQDDIRFPDKHARVPGMVAALEHLAGLSFVGLFFEA